MGDDRTLAPMALDTILPMIRTLHALQERGEYATAAELDERIRQPIVVAGRTLAPCGDEDAWHWWCHDVMVSARADAWSCVVTAMGDDTAIQVQTQGAGPTIAAALADAQTRYRAAIGDVLMRMGVLLREVTP